MAKEHHVWRPPDGTLELSPQDGQGIFVDQMFENENQAAAEDTETEQDKDAGYGRDAQRLRPVGVVGRPGARQRAVPLAAQLVHVAGSRVARYE